MPGDITINGHATRTKSAFRMEYSAGINIKAKTDKVWTLMTDAEGFPRWNSTVKSIEGAIGPGQSIKLIATIAPRRTFNLKVGEFVPGKMMVWSEGEKNRKESAPAIHIAGVGDGGWKPPHRKVEKK